MASIQELAKLKLAEIPEERIVGTPKVDFTKPLDLTVLRGKVALITGGASGIGFGIARALAEHGAYVAILDCNSATGEAAAQTIIQEFGLAPSMVKFFQTDVVSWDSQLAAFKKVLEWSGNHLDIVIASAGLRSNNISHYLVMPGPNQDPVKPPVSTLEVNFLGSHFTSHLALSYFSSLHSSSTAPIQKPSTSTGALFRPQFLFLCSMAGYLEQTHCPDYCASKHGIRGMWKALRNDTHRYGNAQVNLLAPGFTETPLLGGLGSRLEEAGVRLASVEDCVAGALRCVADGDVTARAVAVVRSAPDAPLVGDTDQENQERTSNAGRPLQPEPGSANFDLCDDMADFMSGPVLLERYRHGAFHRLPNPVGNADPSSDTPSPSASNNNCLKHVRLEVAPGSRSSEEGAASSIPVAPPNADKAPPVSLGRESLATTGAANAPKDAVTVAAAAAITAASIVASVNPPVTGTSLQEHDNDLLLAGEDHRRSACV